MTGTVSFGKYKGYKWSDVPSDYIEWLIRNAKLDIEKYEKELKIREAEEVVDAEPGSTLDIIVAGYRKLAMEYHPDKGGSTEVMQKLNAAYLKLKRMFQA